MKLVVWDLDDTIWTGTYMYDGEKVVACEGVDVAIREFDRIGVLQSIISRNSPDVYSYVEKLGINKYFILPKVNWENKSLNMERLLNEVHILPKDVVFVDNDYREREEMHLSFPDIYCAHPTEIHELLHKAVPSGSNEERKKFFTDEAKRLALGDDFVKMLDLELDVHRPKGGQENDRILELINRSNQLHATGNRYDSPMELFSKYYIIVGYPKDKYGEYGLSMIAGYAEFENQLYISEFVVSCRVMDRKLIEPFLWAIQHMTGYPINLDFIKTKYNEPLWDRIMELEPYVGKLTDEGGFRFSFPKPFVKPEGVRVKVE